MATKSIATISPKKLKDITKAIGGLKKWAHNCHACSLAMIQTGLLPDAARVARGWHSQVRSQHSWVVLGDPYDNNVIILDGTLWSYTDTAPIIFYGKSRKHVPHGKGNIWDHGFPEYPTGPIIHLDQALSDDAYFFLSQIAPLGLDFRGWATLANSPMQGWPSKEIITAMYNTSDLRGLVPIDIVGMVTDLNPHEMYR